MSNEIDETNTTSQNDYDYSEPVKDETMYYSKQNRKMMTTAKQIIWLLTINGILWVWCSYVLAWFDKIQIAESLSSNVCTVILGQTIGYLITKTVENVFRYNPRFGGDSTYFEDQSQSS